MVCKFNYTFQNLNDSCKVANQGGIKELYIIDYDKIKAQVTGDTLTQYIENITFSTTGDTFAKYTLAKNTSSLEMAGEYTDTNTQYRNTLTFQLIKITPEKRGQLMALDQHPLVVIVRDSNDLYWYLGFNNYASVTASSAQTGTNQTDVNHMEITIEDVSAERPYTLSKSMVTLVQGRVIPEPEPEP